MRITFILVGFLMVSCSLNGQVEGDIMTVSGTIPVEKMGTCLVHEHVLVDWAGADSTGYHRWDRAEVAERVLPFLLEAKDHGVNTLFECTPAYLGRDPYLLKELSQQSGIHIVTNTGYYGARENKFIPHDAFDLSAQELADLWIGEYENGIDNSGVFPGFIKIAVDRDDSLSPIHQKIVRAAAIAHRETGLTIVSHTGPDSPALAQLEILKEEGVSPGAFVWTHAQRGSIEGYSKAAGQGAWISLDNVKHTLSDDPDKKGRIGWFVETLTRLKEEGLLHKVLISHDAGWYTAGEENGGDFRGYTEVFTHLVPALMEHGFSREEVDQLLVLNPARAYSIRVRLLTSSHRSAGS